MHHLDGPWLQVSTGKRSLVETAIGPYKSIIGRQQTEVAIGCAALNRMLACARPKSIRRNGPAT